MLDKEAGRDNRRRVIENTPCNAKRHYCHSERSEESPKAKRFAKSDCHVATLLTMTK